MKSEMPLGPKAGVTLIELLVVVLIIVILAVAMLPALEPFITRAKYAADAIPALGNLRTQIALYKAEKEYLPGLQRNHLGDVLSDPVAITGLRWGNSFLLDMDYTVDADDLPGDPQPGFTYGQTLSALNVYYIQNPAVGEAVPDSTFVDNWTELTETTAKNNHFARDLGISGTDLTGNNVKPENMIYAAACGGFKGNKHLFVVGAFGDGEKIKSGTGYAILEVANGSHLARPKFTATWRRWKPGYEKADCTVDQMLITFANAADIIAISDSDDPEEQARMANNVFIPHELMGDDSIDQGVYATAMTALRAGGWDF